jgi:hypothetical protein
LRPKVVSQPPQAEKHPPGEDRLFEVEVLEQMQRDGCQQGHPVSSQATLFPRATPRASSNKANPAITVPVRPPKVTFVDSRESST